MKRNKLFWPQDSLGSILARRRFKPGDLEKFERDVNSWASQISAAPTSMHTREMAMLLISAFLAHPLFAARTPLLQHLLREVGLRVRNQPPGQGLHRSPQAAAGLRMQALLIAAVQVLHLYAVERRKGVEERRRGGEEMREVLVAELLRLLAQFVQNLSYRLIWMMMRN